MRPEQRAAVDRLIASIIDGTWEQLTETPGRGPDVTLADGSYAYAFRRFDGSITWALYERYCGSRIDGGSVTPETARLPRP